MSTNSAVKEHPLLLCQLRWNFCGIILKVYYFFSQEGHMGVLSLLLSHGADPTLQDHHGRDPYRVALRNNNAAVAGGHFMK